MTLLNLDFSTATGAIIYLTWVALFTWLAYKRSPDKMCTTGRKVTNFVVTILVACMYAALVLAFLYVISIPLDWMLAHVETFAKVILHGMSL